MQEQITQEQIIAVLKLVASSKVYRTRDGGSQEYLDNVGVVQHLLRQGWIGSIGNCRRDYLLTPSGHLILDHLGGEND